MRYFRSIGAKYEELSGHLYADERIIVSQNGVGLYNGNRKDDERQSGWAVLTSHRLFYIDDWKPEHSCYADLSNIKQLEFYAGFLKSSAKITVQWEDEESKGDPNTPEHPIVSGENWTCPVCGMNNASVLTTCSLCGVKKVTRVSSVKTRLDSQDFNDSMESLDLGNDSTSSAPQSGGSKGIACPTCTFMNHHSMSRCELCNSPLPAKNTGKVLYSSSVTKASAKIAFRKGGEKMFYNQLKMAIEAKDWLQRDKASSALSTNAHKNNKSVGIDHLLKRLEHNAKHTENDIEGAFKDLDALMTNARQMISVAQGLKEKVKQTDKQVLSEKEQQALALVESSLVNIGFMNNTVITKEDIEDNTKYYAELAKELVHVMADNILAEQQIISLDLAWCLWNRARGVAMVSPEDMKRTLPYLSKFGNGRVYTKTFQMTGMTVIHTRKFLSGVFLNRILEELDVAEAISASSDAMFFPGLSTLEIAQLESISVESARNLLEDVELTSGAIVRDELSRDGIRWFRNKIMIF